MRSDFAIFILTHERSDRVFTFDTLRKGGYTGAIWIVIDDEDTEREAYQKRYGDRVLVFNKRNIAARFDEGDNFHDRRSVFYARNACWALARKVGVRYFMQCDDDYDRFDIRFNAKREFGYWRVKKLDRVIDLLVDYLIATPALSIAMSQGGDHLGGAKSDFSKRKAMNTFVCDVEREFAFVGRLNEDVNTYVWLGRRGELFLTIPAVMVTQRETQSNPGGMTGLYEDWGTYVKSFYSVMYVPSAVKIEEMKTEHHRIHHAISWRHTSAAIVRERYRRTSDAIEAPPPVTRSLGSIFDRTSKRDFTDLIALCGFSARKSELVAAFVEHRKAHLKTYDQSSVGDLERRWYASLDTGDPDYSVYSDPVYLSDLWLCWTRYSAKGIKAIAKAGLLERFGDVATVLDAGCGFGYTSAALRTLFPRARIVGTNLPDSFQYKAAVEIAKAYRFEMRADFDELGDVDLVLASEYFEHFVAPIEHLDRLVEAVHPRWLIVANGFNGRSIGHFNEYVDRGKRRPTADMSRVFNAALRERGFQKLKTNVWNDRPSVWERATRP